jgi:hypothetical protein
MRRASIVLVVLATTLAGRAPLAQAQESSAPQLQAQESSAPQAQAQGSRVPQAQKGPTVGGHIGFVLPLVTRSGGQTISDLTDQFSVGFPVGITVKGTGRMAFDLELVPTINTKPRQTTLTVHPGLVWNLGHGFGAGGRLAFDVNSPSWGFTPLINHSWPIKHNNGLFKAYFVEADLPVRFSRPVGGPATNPVSFAMHFGVSF